MSRFKKTFFIAFLCQAALLLLIALLFYMGGPSSGVIKNLMFIMATIWSIVPGWFGIESVAGIILFMFLLITFTSACTGWYLVKLQAPGKRI